MPHRTPRARSAPRPRLAAAFPAVALAFPAVAAAPPPINIIHGDFHTADVAVGDLDGDGRLDLVAAGYYEDSVSWYQQTDDGWIRHHILSLCGASSVLLHDIDGDGDLDVVAASRVTDEVWWLQNEPSEGDSPRSFVPRLALFDHGAEPHSVSAADVDGDGTPDLLVALAYSPDIRILRNVGGNGSTFPFLVDTITVPGNGVSWIRGEDFDGDGDIDIIAATPWDSTIGVNYYWFANDGTGQFGPLTPIAGDVDLEGAFVAAVADMDGDGRSDLVTLSDWADGNRTVNWFRRLDDAGTEWSDAHVVDADFAGSDGSQSLHVVDLDGDGRPDIIGGSSFSGAGLRVWWNRGPGATEPLVFAAQDLAPGFAAHSVTAADLDGDGALEVVAGSWGFYTGVIASWSLVEPPCPGDLDADGSIGPPEVAAVLSAWGATGPRAEDLDEDGTVGIGDLMLLLSRWGDC